MKKIFLTLAIVLGLCAPSARAWDLNDLLGKARESLGNTSTQDVLGAVDALFSNNDFDLNSLEGTWVVSGSAVGLDSENALSRIGGKAATLALEKKIDPYFTKYGLTGATITFDKEGNFTLKLKKMEIKGTVSKTGEGKYETAFNAFGSNRLRPMDTWFEKGATGSNLDVMWDASRAMTLLQSISSFLKLKSASTISSLLNQYENMYLGFKLTRQK